MKHLKRPCDACPWRKDAVPGRFTEERWAALVATSDTGRGSAGLGDPLFACHKTEEGAERACAGWLAQEGGGHIAVRVAVVQGHLPVEALTPGKDWPELHETFAQAAAHDLGYDILESQ